MTVFDIQKALMAKGFDPGVIDGVWGRRTAAAVRAFQATNGLLVDGIVGPVTAAALLGKAPKYKSPLDDQALVWFQEAWRLSGVKERPGAANNPQILEWASNLGIPYDSDDIAWCGLFVAHCVGSTLSSEPLPISPLGARNWLKFGGPCPPQPGAVAVFWRVKRDSWQGHVGFYVGEDKTAYHILGGNQSNSVNVARIAKDRLLGCRWPGSVPAGAGKPVHLTASGKLSTNEA